MKDVYQQRKFLTLLEDNKIKAVHISKILGSQDLQDLALALSINEGITYFCYDVPDYPTATYTQRNFLMAALQNNNIAVLDLSRPLPHGTQVYNIQRLTSIPKILKTDHVLRFLDLSNNGLGDEAGRMLGEGMKGNKTIKHLNLSNNFLSYVGIEKLIFALQYNDTLEHFNLSHNTIGPQGAEYMQPFLENTISLKVLNLKSTGLSQAMKLIAASLSKNTTVTDLNLSTNGISHNSEVLKSLAAMLIDNATLKILDLSDNSMQNCFRILAEALCNVQTLRSLNISSNNINAAEDYAGLAKLLSSGNSIVKLNLWGNSLNGKPEIMADFYEAIADNRNIIELNLANCSLQESGVILLAKYIASNKTLRHLNLSHNAINEPAMIILAKSITEAGTICSLNVADNNIGTKGAEALSCLLGQIKYLNIARNSSDINAAKFLSLGLTEAKKLISLDISGNYGIGSAGAALIARALEYCNSLIKLDLSGCSINYNDLSNVSTELAKNKFLTVLSLKNNNLNNNITIKIIADLIKSNPYLASIDLCDTGFNVANPNQAPELTEAINNSSLVYFKFGDQDSPYDDLIRSKRFVYQNELKKLGTLSSEEYIDAHESVDITRKKLTTLIKQICALKDEGYLHPEIGNDIIEFKDAAFYLRKIADIAGSLAVTGDFKEQPDKFLYSEEIIGAAIDYVSNDFA